MRLNETEAGMALGVVFTPGLLSAAARKRVADAQRARWAKIRAEKGAKPPKAPAAESKSARSFCFRLGASSTGILRRMSSLNTAALGRIYPALPGDALGFVNALSRASDSASPLLTRKLRGRIIRIDRPT